MAPNRDRTIELVDHQPSPYTPQTTIHVCFGKSYVTVNSTVPQVTEGLISSVEPMLSAALEGSEAGFLQIFEDGKSVIIHGRDSHSDQSFKDAASAARALYQRVLKIFIDARPDLLWMHAGVVSFQGRAVALVAPSAHGKSTLVAELLRLGCKYLSDEIAPIDPVAKIVLPFPLVPYRRVPVCQPCATHNRHRSGKLRVELTPAQISPIAFPLARIYFLYHSRGDAATRSVGCSPGAAVVELLRNSLHPSESRDEEIQRLCALVKSVNTAYLYYSSVAEATHIISSDLDVVERINC